LESSILTVCVPTELGPLDAQYQVVEPVGSLQSQEPSVCFSKEVPTVRVVSTWPSISILTWSELFTDEGNRMVSVKACPHLMVDGETTKLPFVAGVGEWVAIREDEPPAEPEREPLMRSSPPRAIAANTTKMQMAAMTPLLGFASGA
jgi:hypothetical protein